MTQDLKRALAMYCRKVLEGTVDEVNKNEFYEIWCEAGMRTLDDLAGKIKDCDVQKLSRFAKLEPVLQDKMLEVMRRKKLEVPQPVPPGKEAMWKANITELLGNNPSKESKDLVETAATLDFKAQEALERQEKYGGTSEVYPEESLWRLLEAQKDKDKFVINYVNFAAPQMLADQNGGELAPPGLGPEPEKEEDAYRIPSLEAWKRSYKKWAAGAVAYNQITLEVAKAYEALILKLVEKNDRQFACQRIVWWYDTEKRKDLERQSRLQAKKHTRVDLGQFTAKNETLWNRAWADYKVKFKETDPVQRDQKERIPDITQEDNERRKDEAAKRRAQEKEKKTKDMEKAKEFLREYVRGHAMGPPPKGLPKKAVQQAFIEVTGRVLTKVEREAMYQGQSGGDHRDRSRSTPTWGRGWGQDKSSYWHGAGSRNESQGQWPRWKPKERRDRSPRFMAL